MNSQPRWLLVGVAGLLLGLADGASAIGMTAVTRRTVMGGVPGTAAAPTVAGNNGATVFSPQPSAAAAMLLPGQTPLAAGGPAPSVGNAGAAPMAQPIAVQPVPRRPFAVPFSRPIVSVARPTKAVTALAPQTGTNLIRGNSINVAP